MSNIEQVIVTEQGTVLATTDNMSVVVTGIMGPPGASSINSMADIDKSELVDGATLVYRATSDTWKATNRLDSQILEAGQF